MVTYRWHCVNLLQLLLLHIMLQIIGGAINKDLIHLWPCAMLTAGLMLAFKCLSADQARSSIDWEVYICIAFAFAVRCVLIAFYCCE